jgi:hypothetical protein
MTWIKPEFEITDLCSEVTSYLYHRQGRLRRRRGLGACPGLRPKRRPR